MKKTISSLFLVAVSSAVIFSFTNARAADHGDGPSASNDPSADIGDLYFFLDPNDNSRAVLTLTMRGFIIPSEAVNMGIFDPTVVFRLLVEGTGDPIPDATINVTFSRRTSTASAQIATVKMMQGENTVFDFVAPATNPSLSSTGSPTFVVTTDPASGVKFFAGEVDDPFFFDIPAFSRFVASVLAGTPDPTVFDRARDSFAGYNTMAFSLSIPNTLLPSANNVTGLAAMSLRPDLRTVTNLGNLSTRGQVTQGENVLIGGTIVTGTMTKRVLVRAIGPSLAASGPLGNPKVTLFNSQAQIVATNNDWQDTQAAEITATGLAPTDPNEAAIIATLAPGAYTAVVEGEGGTTGVALVEFYDLESASTQPGALRQVDRLGVPAVNVALVPFSRKDEYNTGTPQEDAAGRFAADIVGTLRALGTNDANIGILASVAVTNGDYLRLNLTTANSGPGGGNNAGAAFPNGRRLNDDVVDILLSFITNQSGIGDNVNANDVSLTNTFPFFAPSQQPRNNGVIDDNTRN
jgi:Domain of unknown function (DUF4331)